MSIAGVIYLADAGSREWALSSVAGRSLLLRMLLTAVRAGVSRIGLPRSLADDSVLSQIRRDPRLAPVVFSLEDLDPGSEPILLLPADAVVHAASLAKLSAAGRSGIAAALEESKGSPSPILVMAGDQAHALRDQLVAGSPIGEELESQVRSGKLTLLPGDGYFIPVTDRRSQREAEAALYRSLGTEADSVVDRLINRRCSRVLTRLLVRLDVAPNTVTLASFGFGLLAAWQFWFATPGSCLLGFLFYLMGVVADHSDGDIARLTFRESTLGRWLDISVDTATNILLVLAMAASASVVGGPTVFVAGGLAAVGFLMSTFFGYIRQPRTERSERLGHVLVALGTRDPFYLVLIGFAAFSWKAPWALPWVIWVLAAGSQAYWLSWLARNTLAPR